jgi:hypothetical protein
MRRAGTICRTSEEMSAYLRWLQFRTRALVESPTLRQPIETLANACWSAANWVPGRRGLSSAPPYRRHNANHRSGRARAYGGSPAATEGCGAMRDGRLRRRFGSPVLDALMNPLATSHHVDRRDNIRSRC